MEKEYYLINPAAIDERYFQKVLQAPCNGVGVTDGATGEVLCHTYSAFVLAIITRAHGHLDGVFWTHGGGVLPVREFALAYRAGYADGQNAFYDFTEQINNGEMSAAEVLKTIHRKGREAKLKCTAPLPLSIKHIRETGYHTGQAVAASSIMHQNPAVFGQVFGVPLDCTPGRCVFEITKPLDYKPTLSIVVPGKGVLELSNETFADLERDSIQMHSFIGNRKRAFAEGREHLVSEAERYNRTDATVHGNPVNEKAFAEHTLQKNFKATIRMDFQPGNKVTVKLDESLYVPPYIGIEQAVQYHGYVAQQAEAAKKEFLQNSILTKAQTQKRKKPEFDSLDELFHDVAQKEKCIDALKKVRVGKNKNRRTGIISGEGAWIKKNPNKSVLLAWITVLRKESKIKTVDDLTLCRLLENHFPGLMLSADASNFRKCTDAATDYEADFLRLIK